MTPKIVEFNNGKYAIQTSRFPKKYLDLQSDRYFSWEYLNTYFKNCLSDLETCKIKLSEYPYKIIKIL